MAKPQVFFKLRVKLGDQEFEAEGSGALVCRQFDEFRSLVTNRSREQRHDGSDRPDVRTEAKDGKETISAVDTPTHLIKTTRYDRHTGQLSLRALPGGKAPAADAALLLLLAHRELRREEDVSVMRLIASLKQSGCPVARLDRTLSVYTREHLVLKTGRGKGGSYRLTNQGAQKALELADELAGRASGHPAAD